MGKAVLRWEGVRPYYRLLYNAAAIVTLALVIKITHGPNEVMLWRWDGLLWWVEKASWCIGGLLFWLSFRSRDFWEFFGLRAFMRSRTVEAPPDEPVTTGIYGLVRHPQFLAGFVLLWSRDMTDATFVINVVLSLYLLAGARLEEARLEARMGDKYRAYRRNVPGFIPRRIPCRPFRVS